jgi:type II secretory pathway pseudopilin PulG
MKRAHTQAGFSLVETLVAIMIFILTVGVLAQSLSIALNAIANMEIQEGHEHDFQFVRDQVLTISDTQSLSLGGQVQTPEGGQGTWAAETETTETPDLFQLNLNITLEGGDASNGGLPADSANETIYVERPAFSETDDESNLLSNIHDNLSTIRTQQAWP